MPADTEMSPSATSQDTATATLDSDLDLDFADGTAEADSSSDDFTDQLNDPGDDDDSGDDEATDEQPVSEGDGQTGTDADPLAAADPLADDEQPKVNGKMYSYSEGYVKRELLPARDFLRQLRQEVDPSISVQQVKQAVATETTMNAIIDDFVHGGTDGMKRVVSDFANLARHNNNPAALNGLAVTAAQTVAQMNPEFFAKTFVQPFEARGREGAFTQMQREAHREFTAVRQATLNRLGANATEEALLKDNEYYGAQMMLWAAQTLAHRLTGKFIADDKFAELDRSPAADPNRAERESLQRERAALEQRQNQEQQHRVQTWQTEVAQAEFKGIGNLFDTLVAGKLANQPEGIRTAVRQHIINSVDQTLRGDKTFMERYGQALRAAQRSMSAADRENALKIWNTRADMVLRTQAKAMLAAASASAQTENGKAHAKAAASNARREPSGQGTAPKRTIVTPIRDAKNFSSVQAELNDVLG